MSSRLLSAISAGILSLVFSAFAEAALVSRLGGQAYYDDVLDITWLADANLAASNTFGLATGVSLGTHPSDSSGNNGVINAGGSLNWPGALFWIDAMNADGGTGYLGFNDWRLPTLSPVNGSSINNTFSNNATTDKGYADSVGWVDGAANPVSEMGHMNYVNLGNLGFCIPDNGNPSGCTEQTGWGLSSTGPFSNLQPGFYWSDTELNSSNAWRFDFLNGDQNNNFKSLQVFAWGVRPGDVSAVPIPASAWLFTSGLIGLIGVVKKRAKSVQAV